jgi:hypothetical protein
MRDGSVIDTYCVDVVAGCEVEVRLLPTDVGGQGAAEVNSRFSPAAAVPVAIGIAAGRNSSSVHASTNSLRMTRLLEKAQSH